MGDVGALGIGSALAFLALTLNTHLLLLLICGINVMEAGSVAIQMGVFKATGRKRRLFRMSPIHHHFELAGWPETTVIIRFWLISAICVGSALAIFIADFTRVDRGDRWLSGRRSCTAWRHRRGRGPRPAAAWSRRDRHRRSHRRRQTRAGDVARRRSACPRRSIPEAVRRPLRSRLAVAGRARDAPADRAPHAARASPVVSEIELAYRWEQQRPASARWPAPDARDHRHRRQDHHHRAHGGDPAAPPALRTAALGNTDVPARRRHRRRRATRRARRVRGRVHELPAGVDAALPGRRRGVAQPRSRPSQLARLDGDLRGSQGADLGPADARATWRSDSPTIRS